VGDDGHVAEIGPGLHGDAFLETTKGGTRQPTGRGPVLPYRPARKASVRQTFGEAVAEKVLPSPGMSRLMANVTNPQLLSVVKAFLTTRQ